MLAFFQAIQEVTQQPNNLLQVIGVAGGTTTVIGGIISFFLKRILASYDSKHRAHFKAATDLTDAMTILTKSVGELDTAQKLNDQRDKLKEEAYKNFESEFRQHTSRHRGIEESVGSMVDKKLEAFEKKILLIIKNGK